MSELSLENILSDPDDLKKEFKSIRDSIEQTENQRNWSIRVHRALSWYQRSFILATHEELAREMAEARFLLLWIGFISLADSWDDQNRQPSSEGTAVLGLVDVLGVWDRGRLLPDFLGRNKALIKQLLANPYLHLDFWMNPNGDSLASKIKNSKQGLDKLEQRSIRLQLLKDILMKVFLFRNQLVHGSSTAGSKLNRNALADCLTFMQQFAPLVLTLAIFCGLEHTWPPLCYPPVDSVNKSNLARL